MRATVWMKLENVMLAKASHRRPHTIWLYLCECLEWANPWAQKADQSWLAPAQEKG